MRSEQTQPFSALSPGLRLMIVIAWLFTAITHETTGLSAEPAKRAVLVVQREYVQNLQLETELDRYVALVRQRFDTDLVVYPADGDISPAKLRPASETTCKWRNQGAFLVGQFQFPTFHNACGDESTMFAYYSDLDGQIEDRDRDSKFDYYDPWLKGEASKKPVHELWIAVLRPYFHHYGRICVL